MGCITRCHARQRVLQLDGHRYVALCSFHDTSVIRWAMRRSSPLRLGPHRLPADVCDASHAKAGSCVLPSLDGTQTGSRSAIKSADHLPDVADGGLDGGNGRWAHAELGDAEAEKQGTKLGSPAILPHMPTGIPAAFAARQVMAMAASTAGCGGYVVRRAKQVGAVPQRDLACAVGLLRSSRLIHIKVSGRQDSPGSCARRRSAIQDTVRGPSRS